MENLRCILAQVTDSEAYRQGQFFGVALIMILLVLGIVRCLVVLRRPGTERLGIVALLLFLLVWVCGSIMSGANFLFRDSSHLALAIIRAAGSVIVLATLPASFVLAILGLIRFNRDRERFRRGRAAAIWALVLSSLMGLAMMGTFAFGMVKAQMVKEGGPAIRPSGTPEELTFEDRNFKFDFPGRPWIKLNPKAVNPVASLVLRSSQSSMFMIIAERGGIDLDMTTEDLVTVTKDYLKGVSDDAEITDLDPVEHAGISFAQYRASASISGRKFHYHYRVAAHNGFFYQLISHTLKSPGVAESESQFLAGKFQLLDPEKVCYSSGKAIDEPVVRKDLGLTMHLNRGSWVEWDSMEEDFPEGDAGAIYATYGTMAIVSFDLRGHQPSMEELARVCHDELWSTEYPDDVEAETFESNGITGIRSRLGHRSEGVNWLDTIWVFQHRGRGWCIITWVDEAAENRRDRVEQIIELLEFDEKPVPEDLENLTERQRKVRALLFNDLGLLRYGEEDYEGAREYFLTAVELNPEDPVMTMNVAHALEEMDRPGEGAAFLEDRLDRFPDQVEMRTEIASLHQLAGEGEKAVDAYRAAFSAGCSDPDTLLTFIRLLVAENREREALEAVEVFEKEHPSDRVLRWKANIHANLNQFREAADILERRLDSKPFDVGLAYDLGRYCLNLDDGEGRCLELCDLMDEADGPSWDVSQLRGHAYMNLERFHDAKRAYEAALELDGENEEIKRSLAQASAALGEGSNSLVKQEIPPVAIPPALLEKLESSDPELEDSHGYQSLRRVTSIWFQPGMPKRKSFHVRLKITGDRGLNRLNTLRFSFDPLRERIFVNHLVVRDEEGEVLGEGELSTYYVMDESDSVMATEDQMLNVPVPGLRIGAVLDYVVTMEEQAPAEEYDFSAHNLFVSKPSAYSAVCVSGDVSRLRSATSGDLIHTVGEGFQSWHLFRPPLIPNENMRPNLSRFLPFLWLGDATRSWGELGEDYLEKLESLLSEDAPVIRTTADRVAGNLETREEKIEALARFVQRELTYHAIEFGKRGRIPLAASRCIRNRYGDCKEHSLLLHQLLRAQGIESCVVMVNANGDLVPELPSLNQFDHMILWVPDEEGGGRFFDCTNDHLPPGRWPPDDLGGKKALVLEPGNVRVESIPAYPPDSSRISSVRKLRVEDGNLVVEERVSLEGYPASWSRGYFSARDTVGNKKRVQSFLNYDGLRVKSVDISRLSQPEHPLVIDLTYELIRNVKWKDDGDAEILLPGAWERYYIEPYYLDERVSPLEIAYPLHFSSRVEFEGDAALDWKTLETKRLRKSGDDDFHRWDWRIESREGHPVLEWNYRLQSNLFPADRYRDYQKSCEQALAIWNNSLRVRGAPKGE